MVLQLTLLGDFSVTDAAGNALSLPTRKSAALLAYLAVHADRPQPRERLKALLWSDRDEQHARQSLNHALLSIRRLAKNDGPALLESNGEQLTLRSDAVDIDVDRFRAALAGRPMEAVALYPGPFLDGLSVPDPVFEEWLAVTRSEIHTQLCDAVEQEIAAAADEGDAVDLARHLIRLDPVRESGHQHLMRLLYERGDRASALRQYRECADVLGKELAVEPGAATRALFEAIRRDDVAPVIVEAPAAADAPQVAPAVVPIPRPVPGTRRLMVPAVAAFTGLMIGAGAVAVHDRMSPRQTDFNAMLEENKRILAESIDREANLESERTRIAALTLERAVEAARRQAAETAQQHAEGVVRQHTFESARRQAEELLRQAQEAAKKQVAEIVRQAEQAAIAKAEKAVERARARKELAVVPHPPARPARSAPDAASKVAAVKLPAEYGKPVVPTAHTRNWDDPVLDIGNAAEPLAVNDSGGETRSAGRPISTIDYAKDRDSIKQAIFDYYDVYGHGDDKTDHPKPSLLATVMRDVGQVSVERIQGNEVEVSVEYIASTFSGLNETNPRKARFRLKKQRGSFSVVEMWDANPDEDEEDSGSKENVGIAANRNKQPLRRDDRSPIRLSVAPMSIDGEGRHSETLPHRTSKESRKHRDAIAAAIADYYFTHGYPSESTGAWNDTYYGWEVPGVRIVSVRKVRSGELEVSVEVVASVVNNYQSAEAFKKERLLVREREGKFSIIKSWDA